MDIRFINAKKRFLDQLKGVSDPEKKRKIIGKVFIDVFQEKAGQLKNVKYLAQGTLYPDVIESRSAFGGPTSVIKSHHNVGGLPKKMKLKLIEPLSISFQRRSTKTGQTAWTGRRTYLAPTFSRTRTRYQDSRRRFRETFINSS